MLTRIVLVILHSKKRKSALGSFRLLIWRHPLDKTFHFAEIKGFIFKKIAYMETGL